MTPRFVIVRNDDEVLSTPHGWLCTGVTLATGWRYALTFETRSGAAKCAYMHGATVHTIGDWDEATRYRTGDGGHVEYAVHARVARATADMGSARRVGPPRVISLRRAASRGGR